MMIVIDDKIISQDILEQHFMCDLQACAGVCCVQGDSGAPLEAEEAAILRREYPHFEYALTPQGRQVIKKLGFAVYDSDGDLVTPLLNHSEECAYSYYDEANVCLCAIEKAFRDNKTHFCKPISCHLYPIRLKQIGNYIALNYHRWHICEPACAKGNQAQLPLFKFLREPLIRKFGEDFYAQLENIGNINQ
jgi:hypothetical protein